MVESRTFSSIQPQRHSLERFRTDRTEPTERIQTGVFIKWIQSEICHELETDANGWTLRMQTDANFMLGSLRKFGNVTFDSIHKKLFSGIDTRWRAMLFKMLPLSALASTYTNSDGLEFTGDVSAPTGTRFPREKLTCKIVSASILASWIHWERSPFCRVWVLNRGQVQHQWIFW